jgi:hypothetical protein
MSGQVCIEFLKTLIVFSQSYELLPHAISEIDTDNRPDIEPGRHSDEIQTARRVINVCQRNTIIAVLPAHIEQIILGYRPEAQAEIRMTVE